jgi:hypothetical protein
MTLGRLSLEVFLLDAGFAGSAGSKKAKDLISIYITLHNWYKATRK